MSSCNSLFHSWRTTVSQKIRCNTSEGPPPGLLIPYEWAGHQQFALRARSRVATAEAGVSLAFLKQLAGSIKVQFSGVPPGVRPCD